MREDVILKYAERRAPRYTSYPTAPHFTPAISAADYAGWLAALPADEAVSLYLHVPFCREMCWYCGCHTKATRRLEPVEKYADVLLAEIDLVAGLLPKRARVSHIHWGGGSPAYLRPARFAELMDRLRRRFDVLPDAEIAVEVDPRRLSPDHVAAFAESGVTRASLGVQTFDANVQAAVNRIQNFSTVADCVSLLRGAGVDAINFDLLYGLPRQTAQSAKETAQSALELEPDRFAVFGYAHLPHLKPHQKMIVADDLPDAASRLAQASAISATLRAAGYVPVGLDHFAKPDDALARALRQGKMRRNFQGYTTDDAAAVIGFGASAIGSLPQGYVQNTPATHEWERAVLAGRTPIARGYRLTDEDRLRREIIERLMCDLKADIRALAARRGLPAPQADLAEFVDAGVVTIRGANIEIGEDFRPLARNIAAAFDAHLARGPARYSLSV
ncbi:MAG: oxygen-independent coproporphyrinogen III oxidase [Alphaproteobacteria bacterium]|nr:oxygen-independent coproporphyrinogen III oxidase [Alphaproteobacteria bacterium]